MKRKEITKSILMLLLMVVMVMGATACGDSAPTNGAAEKWQISDDTSFSDDSGAGEGSMPLPSGTIEAGRTESGGNIFAFTRFYLGTKWFENEIEEARLFMKLKNADAPDSLKIALLTGSWDGFFTTHEEANALVNTDTTLSVGVKSEANGWVSIPVTDFVKAWLRGDIHNNGMAIFGGTVGKFYDFASNTSEDESNLPYVAVRGTVGDRPLIYGKFGYTETPLPGADDMGGNCMSYALRDTNMILGSDLGFESGDAENAFREGGIDALADYVSDHAITYTVAHLDVLEISKLRRLETFESKIDPQTEYRIALRVGIDKYSEGNPDFERGNAFDYHFWVQLNDGRWAQKYPTGNSMIVACTAQNIDPAKFPWDAGYVWSEKSRDYYTSKVLYFAVTKDTDEITQHRGEARDRNYE